MVILNHFLKLHLFATYIQINCIPCKNHETEESPSKSKVFLSLHNGRRPLHNNKRNMGQANFYLIMTVQTNYLTVYKIWCLKSAKNFIKNNCLIEKYKTKKGDKT